ncbi:MAG: DUF1579 domain-containing protein [Phycisphaerales bacterium]
MNRLLALMVGTSLMCSAPLLAQDKKAEKGKEMPKAAAPAADGKKGEPSMDEMMKQYEAVGKPGPQHAWLAKSAGVWKTSMKMWEPDGKEVDAGPGEVKCKMTMDGRFLAMSFKSNFMGQEFQGGGMMGYNNIDKRFESVWHDTMGTGLMMMTGQTSPDGKTLTMSGQCTEPDGTKCEMKQVSKWASDTSYTETFYKTIGGKEMKQMEIVYTKTGDAPGKDEKKAEKKDDKHDKKTGH